MESPIKAIIDEVIIDPTKIQPIIGESFIVVDNITLKKTFLYIFV